MICTETEAQIQIPCVVLRLLLQPAQHTKAHGGSIIAGRGTKVSAVSMVQPNGPKSQSAILQASASQPGSGKGSAGASPPGSLMVASASHDPYLNQGGQLGNGGSVKGGAFPLAVPSAPALPPALQPAAPQPMASGAEQTGKGQMRLGEPSGDEQV